MNLIKLVLERTAAAETPQSFFYWATLCSISAVVKRNVWINKKIYKLYPNLYVLLIAKSGLRKGAATSFARNIVEKCNVTRVIYGRSSIQSIIKELSDQRTFPNGYVLNSASGFLVSGELASSLISDPQAQAILTDLYDSNYHADWTNSLKRDGKEKLRDIYITFFSATNPTLLDEFLDESSIQGGFIARTLLIKEDKKSKLNALIDDDEMEGIQEFDDEEIVGELKSIARLKGQFKFEDEAKAIYKKWYGAFNEKLERGEIRDNTGTSDRLHDHILKISMLLSMAAGSDMIIKAENMDEAIKVCTGDAVRVAEGIGVSKGKSDMAGKTKIFLDELLTINDYKLSREDMLKRRYQDFDSYELDRIVETLSQSKVVDIKRGHSNELYYVLNERWLQEIGRMLRKPTS